MKLLTITTLYPNAAAPNHGVFVENRLDAWRRHSGGEARVIAPVPWFPSTAGIFGRYARYAAAPGFEIRKGIAIDHPRYFLPPKVGMNIAPVSLAHAIENAARQLLAAGQDFDLIDAHYLYPDGVAAARVAQSLGKPFVLTARGSDVTLLTRYARPRALILDAIRRADAVISVAAALKEELVQLGAPAEKISVIGNGVDLERFRPLDRAAIRRRMRLDGLVVASVGGLIARKGHEVVIRAVGRIPDATLLIAGEGPDERSLRDVVRQLGLAERVRFLGALPHADLVEIYNAADALALASAREGWPNILLEAMACGASAVASDAGGSKEVITARAGGRIVEERTPESFAAALQEVCAAADRRATREFATAHSWENRSNALSTLYEDITKNARKSAGTRVTAIKRNQPTRPALLFTIDTEEQFCWDDFSPGAHRIHAPEGVDALQRLCEEFSVRPLYFLTYPVLMDPENTRYFRTLSAEGRADLGIHLHQWSTPPFGGFEGAYYSWQGNLPPAIHATKLATLANAFERVIGYRPIAHRAGRYGVSKSAYREIAAAGIRYDFSPSPGFDYSSAGGPDFSDAGNNPFRVNTECGQVDVIPVCGALALRGGRIFLRQPDDPGLGQRRRSQRRLLTAPFRLSCENARFDELVALTKSLAAAGTPIATFSLHSTSLTPGANSYAPDSAAVAASLALTRRYLEFFVKDFGGVSMGLAGLASEFENVPISRAK